DFAGLGSDFDLVILNSTIQYFPDERYLRSVLSHALEACAPGGSVFIGDVRNSWLQAALHLDVLRSRHEEAAPSRIPEREAVLARIEREPELLVAPQYFWSLSRELNVGALSVTPAPGEFENEFTRYRYDVLMSAGKAARAVTHVRRCERAAELDDALDGLERESYDAVMFSSARRDAVFERAQAAMRLFGRPAEGQRDAQQSVFATARARAGILADASWILCNEFGDGDVVMRRSSDERYSHVELYDNETVSRSAPARSIVEPKETMRRQEAVRAIRAQLSKAIAKPLMPNAIHVVESIPAKGATYVDFTAMLPSRRASP
ncbi:MAG: hypothetical protein JO199_06365, partial [Candidatus Eremiobacteraeota bacterium]|nr:hypothetical protein [Candidatus Eremiobacteraeota bacterium]